MSDSVSLDTQLSESVHSSDDAEKNKELNSEETFPLNTFLQEIGLATPIDYVFQTFAIQKSRQSVVKMNDKELLFLFHVMRSQDLKAEMPFPRSAFLEKVISSDPSLPIKYVIWAVEESPNWSTRTPLSFNEFHLYFQDVLHPNFGYSAEELYKVFDARHDETYFINNGPRSSSVDKKFHVLFVTEKVIVAIQMPEVKYEDIVDSECFTCKWVSLQDLCVARSVSESAVFYFPRKNLVFTEEEKKEYVENMEMDDCSNCVV